MSDLTVAALLAIVTSLTEAMNNHTEALNNHTEALNNHTEALKGAPEASEDKPKRGRKPKAETTEAKEPEAKEPEAKEPEAKEPEAKEGITLQDAQAAVLEVKNKFGSDVAKEVLKDVTGQTMVAKIQPEHYEPLFNACKHVLENGAESKPEKDTKKKEPATLESVKEAGHNLAKLGASYKTQAVQIINEVGGASKIAEVAPENYQALQDALVEAFEQATAQSDDL
nr:MAG TPA: hypothetical protein [Caudoviricetes sp.]